MCHFSAQFCHCIAHEAAANGAEEPEQHPVGTVSEAPAEETSTYADRKQAALWWVAVLQDQVVVVSADQSEALEWKVVSESQSEGEEEKDTVNDKDVGL